MKNKKEVWPVQNSSISAGWKTDVVVESGSANWAEKMVFCYQNCSELLWEKIVLVTEKDFWNSRLKAKNFQKNLRSLEQFIQTV